MYGSDLAEWLLTILLKGRLGEAYNVGSGKEISIADLARLVRSVAGAENEIRICQQPVLGALPARYVPAVWKVKAELKVRLRVELEEAIVKTIAWYRR
jgi:dTDP-glucose 4,6-dehydratase